MEHGMSFKFVIQPRCEKCSKKHVVKTYNSSDIKEIIHNQEFPSISKFLRDHGPFTSTINIDYLNDTIEVWHCEDLTCLLAYHWENIVGAVFDAEDRAKAQVELDTKNFEMTQNRLHSLSHTDQKPTK